MFIELFKRDQYYCPQYLVSRKFKNIARNSTYIYWLTEQDNNAMKLCNDESFSMDELHTCVVVVQSGMVEAVEENILNNENSVTDQVTCLLMYSANEKIGDYEGQYK